MLLAAIAFLHQGSLKAASQAAAAAGFMPDAAETLIGAAHYHGKVTGLVHVHEGDTSAGHTHDPAEPDDGSGVGSIISWMLGPSAVVAQPTAIPLAVVAVTAPARFPSDRLDGIEPDGLSRPPSTPSIA